MYPDAQTRLSVYGFLFHHLLKTAEKAPDYYLRAYRVKEQFLCAESLLNNYAPEKDKDVSRAILFAALKLERALSAASAASDKASLVTLKTIINDAHASWWGRAMQGIEHFKKERRIKHAERPERRLPL